MHAISSLAEAAVVAVATDGFEGTAICCGFVPLPDSGVSPSTLTSELREALPSYMVPIRWLALEEMPKNANGKIDRPKLRELFTQYATQAR